MERHPSEGGRAQMRWLPVQEKWAPAFDVIHWTIISMIGTGKKLLRWVRQDSYVLQFITNSFFRRPVVVDKTQESRSRGKTAMRRF